MHIKESFVAIIQENEGLIYKVAKLYCNSKEDEQDLYQEIVYQLWKSFPSFRNDAKLSTWMYRIALNTAILHLNKQKKKGNLLPMDDSLLNRADTNDPLKEERIAILYTQIKQLNKIDKAIMLLYLDGKSYDEIALITGFTASNIGTKLGRIKQKMIENIK